MLPGLMSFNFCCYIQTVVSEFDAEIIKAWIRLACHKLLI